MSLRRAVQLNQALALLINYLRFFHFTRAFPVHLCHLFFRRTKGLFFHDNETSKIKKGICNKLLSVETDQLKFACYMCSHFSFTNKSIREMIASVFSTLSANQRFYGDLNSYNTPPRSGRSIKVALPFYCLRVETISV